MIKKYFQFIKEAEEVKSLENDASDSSKFAEIKDEVKSMIEKTIEKSGGEFGSFIKSYIKNPEDVKCDGFINDSDIYEFYLKWRNDIDEILSEINFFDEVPTENNAFGLYEYVIKGTEKAFFRVVSMLETGVKLNEAIIDWKTENLEAFYRDCLNSLTGDEITFDEMKRIGAENDIEVVDYDTFLSELPSERLKADAPKKGSIPFFGLANPVTHKARVVVQKNSIKVSSLAFIYHMLKHENIHVGQLSRKGNKDHGEYLGDISDLKKYFSNKDEVMAFSQSISDMVMKFNPRNMEEAVKKLNSVALWNKIKMSVDSKTIKRYLKYIYLYLEKELERG